MRYLHVLTLILVTLKLTGLLSITWTVALLPSLIVVGLNLMCLMLIGLIVVGILNRGNNK